MQDLTATLAQVVSELQAERDRVQLLYDLSRQLTGDLDMPQALRGMLNLGLAGVAGPEGGARGSILLVDENGRPTDWILIRALPRSAQTWVVEEVLRAGLSGWIVQHRDIALVGDCWTDPRWLLLPDDPNPAGSAIGAPLFVEGQVRGCLLLAHPQRQFFGSQHVDLMRAISSHISVVLANALLYRRLEQQVRQLAEANQVQTEFIANMTHELRTPLNAIIGFTELIRDGVSGPVNAVQQEQLDRVLRNSERLLHLITTVMDLSKLEAGVLELERGEFAVPELVHNVLSSVALLAEKKGVGLEVTVDPALPSILVEDLNRLCEVLINLLTNALKFTPSGTVTLRLLNDRPALLQAGPAGVTPVVIPAREIGDPLAPTTGPVWSIEVSDTGIGIAPEHQLLIFERFRQVGGGAQRRAGGAGLGLAIVKKLVTGLGGELYLRSAVDAGSTFRVVLPLRTPDALH